MIFKRTLLWLWAALIAYPAATTANPCGQLITSFWSGFSGRRDLKPKNLRFLFEGGIEVDLNLGSYDRKGNLENTFLVTGTYGLFDNEQSARTFKGPLSRIVFEKVYFHDSYKTVDLINQSDDKFTLRLRLHEPVLEDRIESSNIRNIEVRSSTLRWTKYFDALENMEFDVLTNFRPVKRYYFGKHASDLLSAIETAKPHPRAIDFSRLKRLMPKRLHRSGNLRVYRHGLIVVNQIMGEAAAVVEAETAVELYYILSGLFALNLDMNHSVYDLGKDLDQDFAETLRILVQSSQNLGD